MINIKIFYGSQTGNAQDFSEKIFRYSQNLPPEHVSVEIHEMDYLNFDTFSNNDIFIFVCSTTGQGDPPDNMKIFWKTIMSRSFNKDLSSCNFAVFGLGDSKYHKFNFIAKKLYRRLIQFKATPIVTLGLADDQHNLGIDGEFTPWIKELWSYLENKLNQFMNVNNLLEYCSSNQPILKFEIDFVIADNINDKQCPNEFNTFNLKSNVAMTPSDHFQETRLVTFNNETLKYDSGDIFTLYPQNSIKNIDFFFQLTNLNRFDVINIKSKNLKFKIPEILGDCIITLENVVAYGFDLNSVPRKSFFESFAFLSTFDLEKERLMELSDSNNIDELYTYCFRPKRTILEVLRDFPNTTNNINISQWINLMPFIRPRDYSIASSYEVHKNEIQLLVSRVRFKTLMHDERLGLCSNFICNLKPNDKVFGKIKKGSLKFPNSKVPSILISPGTGIAAFRGYISERMLNETVGEMLLCFGNRYRQKDFYFSDEFERLDLERKLTLLTAFSREENLYIQNKLKAQSELIWKIITECNGYLFICGRSVDMPQQVHDAVKNILITEGNILESQAEQILLSMQRFKRYQTETWS